MYMERCIALLSLAFTLDVGGWLDSRSSRFNSRRKSPQYQLNQLGQAPRDDMDAVE
jgi:hypothetical protein